MIIFPLDYNFMIIVSYVYTLFGQSIEYLRYSNDGKLSCFTLFLSF